MGRRAAVAALSAALEKAFPGLRGTHYAVTSPPTPTYNCIAWAAGESNRWWWPTSSYFWPTGIPREETLLAFVGAYATLGYTRCDDEQREIGFEKVAIYVNARGIPTHAARQLGTGMWTSKLGQAHDIAHTLDGVSGLRYGRVGAVLKRPRDAQDQLISAMNFRIADTSPIPWPD